MDEIRRVKSRRFSRRIAAYLFIDPSRVDSG